MEKLFVLTKDISDYPGCVFKMTKGEIKKLINWNINNRDFEKTVSSDTIAKNIEDNYKIPSPMILSYNKESKTYKDIDGKQRLSNNKILNKEYFIVIILELENTDEERNVMGMSNTNTQYDKSMKVFTDKNMFPFLDEVKNIFNPTIKFSHLRRQKCLTHCYNYDTLKRMVLSAYMRTTELGGIKAQKDAFAALPKDDEWIKQLYSHMNKYVKIMEYIDEVKLNKINNIPMFMAWASNFDYIKDKETDINKIGFWFKKNTNNIIIEKQKTGDGKLGQIFYSSMIKKSFKLKIPKAFKERLSVKSVKV